LVAFCHDSKAMSLNGMPPLAQVRKPLYNSSVARWRRYEQQLEPLRLALGGTIQVGARMGSVSNLHRTLSNQASVFEESHQALKGCMLRGLLVAKILDGVFYPSSLLRAVISHHGIHS